MEIRKNAGYTITNNIFIGNIEIVLGQKDNALSEFVTWQCTGGECYWGHYFNDRLSAEKDMYLRAVGKIEDLQLSQSPVVPAKQNKLKREKDQER